MNFKLFSILIVLTVVFFIIYPAAAETDQQITVTAAGDGSFYLDEEILLWGTNTESGNVYLFITGPNLEPNGEKPGDSGTAAITGNEDTFAVIEVDPDNTWEYGIDARGMGLSQGTYTIYAVMEPNNKGNLSGGIFDTVTIVLKKRQTSAKAEKDTAIEEPVTITASGDGSYYIGEEITLSGINTESENTYLFIAGPNLDPNGDKLSDSGTASVTGNEDTFTIAATGADDTWKYRLDTSRVDFDPGAYTVYAVTEPDNKADISGKAYNTASIVIKRPFISIEVSEPEIQAGTELVFTGTAEGNPNAVAIWIFGFDYWNGSETGSMVTVLPEDDGSYSYVLEGSETAKMPAGEYFAVAQHPMYDDKFGIITTPGDDGNSIFVSDAAAGSTPETLFVVWGDSRLRGADAAEALIEGINSPMVDDTYAMSTFTVEEQPEEPGFFAAIANFFAGLFG